MADPAPITTWPATPGDPNYGIQDVLTIAGNTYILQGASPKDTAKLIKWTDQYDSTIGSKHIDTESTVALTAIGPAVTPLAGQVCRFPLQVAAAITFRGLNWEILDIGEAATYNGLTVWSINIARSKNFPKTDATLPSVPVSTAAVPTNYTPPEA